MPFSRILTQSEKLTTSSRIWTRVTKSISYNNVCFCYTKGTSVWMCVCVCVCVCVHYRVHVCMFSFLESIFMRVCIHWICMCECIYIYVWKTILIFMHLLQNQCLCICLYTSALCMYFFPWTFKCVCRDNHCIDVFIWVISTFLHISQISCVFCLPGKNNYNNDKLFYVYFAVSVCILCNQCQMSLRSCKTRICMLI